MRYLLVNKSYNNIVKYLKIHLL